MILSKKPLPATSDILPAEMAAIRSGLQEVQDDCRQCSLLDYLHVVSKEAGRLSLYLRVPYPCASQHSAWQQAIKTRLAQYFPSLSVSISLSMPALAEGAAAAHVIAISSCKGGVGKSTTAVNLALALQQEGARVGLLDADIYGPSLPLMLGLERPLQAEEDGRLRPLQGHGLQLLSMGQLMARETAIIWRGALASQHLQQLLQQAAWRDLDYLLLDLPPGTGDIALTVFRALPDAAAVVVTSPQQVACVDVGRGLSMLQQLGVPLLGLVENMAFYRCPCCGNEQALFGQGGCIALARRHAIPLLGSLPLLTRLGDDVAAGRPTVAAAPAAEISGQYRCIARRLSAVLSTLSAESR